MKIYINKDNINIFKNIDENFLLILKKNNNKWFSNNLKNNELIELFNYSFCSQTNTIDAILSNKSIIYIKSLNI